MISWWRERVQDLAMALALLTRWPIARLSPTVWQRSAHAAWAWPVAGVAVALPAAGLAWLAIAGGVEPTVAAGMALVAMVLISGGLHEDGLADCADAFWGGRDPQKRLDIMKDSRIGAYGTIALILSIGLRWACLSGLFLVPGQGVAAMIAAAMAGRAAMTVPASMLPHARSEGLARATGAPPPVAAVFAVLLTLGVGLILLGPRGTVAVFLAGLAATLCMTVLIRVKLGGQTGDTLGATQQVAEVMVLVSLSAVLPNT